MAKKSIEQQIVDNVWYAAGHGGEPFLESCCHCALTHRVEYKIDNGRVYFRYTVDDRATKRHRKDRGINKEVTALLKAQAL